MKKVADLLLSNPTAIAAHSARKVGELAGVSETMVVRLAVALGYQGYSELQQEVRQAVYNIYTDIHELKGEGQTEGLHYFQQMMRADQANIERVSQSISPEDLEKAVLLLDNADQIVVAGVHFSFSMAHWFAFSLGLLKPQCRLYRPEDQIHLNHLTGESVLIVFSFYRYALEPLWIAEEAKQKGITVIAFTDSRTAPIVPHADIVFSLELPIRSIIQMSPVIFSIMNSIIMELAKHNDQNVKMTEGHHIRKFYTQ